MTAVVLNLLLLGAAPATAPVPTFVRVAIVDNSGSMAGERIAVVRSELTKVIKQLPPTPDHPLLLIVFHGAVEPTQVFTNGTTAERAIQSLSGNGGGTRIAPALTQSVRDLTRYMHVGNLLVMLYSDGEDGDRKSILKAEEQLDALFAGRSEQGLSQTVFLKRWGGANAELVERLKSHGRAKVLDVGEIEIQPITMDPAVALIRVERDPKNRRRLEVTYCPQVAVRGTFDASYQVGVRFECLVDQVTGDTTTNVLAGGPAPHCTLSVPLSVDAERAGQLDLQFRVHSTAVAQSHSKAILPILPSSNITLPVNIPPLMIHHHLAAKLKNVRATGWTDHFAGQVRCTADLVINVAAVDAGPGIERKLALRAEPAAGLRLQTPLNCIEIMKPGERCLPITFDVPLLENKKRPLLTGPLELTLSVVSKANDVSCDPLVVVVRHPGVEQPPAAETTITPRVERISETVWVDLVDAVAAFDADLVIDVQGPIPHRTSLTLVSPAEVRKNVLAPGTTLRPGRNVLHLQVLAQLQPAKTQKLTFSIVPPSATAALNFKVANDISLQVTAPPPVQLVHVAAGQTQTLIRASLLDSQGSFTLSLLPVPLGAKSARLTSVPRVTATSAGKTATLHAASGTLFHPLPIQFTMPPLLHRSFFLDVTENIDVELRPAPATAAVRGGIVRVAVVRQAPFKRLLVYLAWGLFPIGVLFVVFRIVRRLLEQPRLAPLCLDQRIS